MHLLFGTKKLPKYIFEHIITFAFESVPRCTFSCTLSTNGTIFQVKPHFITLETSEIDDLKEARRLCRPTGIRSITEFAPEKDIVNILAKITLLWDRYQEIKKYSLYYLCDCFWNFVRDCRENRMYERLLTLLHVYGLPFHLIHNPKLRQEMLHALKCWDIPDTDDVVQDIWEVFPLLKNFPSHKCFREQLKSVVGLVTSRRDLILNPLDGCKQFEALIASSVMPNRNCFNFVRTKNVYKLSIIAAKHELCREIVSSSIDHALYNAVNGYICVFKAQFGKWRQRAESQNENENHFMYLTHQAELRMFQFWVKRDLSRFKKKELPQTYVQCQQCDYMIPNIFALSVLNRRQDIRSYCSDCAGSVSEIYGRGNASRKGNGSGYVSKSNYSNDDYDDYDDYDGYEDHNDDYDNYDGYDDCDDDNDHHYKDLYYGRSKPRDQLYNIYMKIQDIAKRITNHYN